MLTALMKTQFLSCLGLASMLAAARRRLRRTRSPSAPTGSPRPSTAATTRPSPTAPTPNTASTSPSPGRPAGRQPALLIAGQIQFYMGGTPRRDRCVKEGIPTDHVAAIFQKDPQILMAIPDAGIKTFADLASAKIIIGKDGFISYFLWMKAN